MMNVLYVLYVPVFCLKQKNVHSDSRHRVCKKKQKKTKHSFREFNLGNVKKKLVKM